MYCSPSPVYAHEKISAATRNERYIPNAKTKLFPTRMIVEVIAVRMEEKVRDNIPPEPGTFASLNFAGR